MCSLKRVCVFCERDKAIVKRKKAPMPESLPIIKVGGVHQIISLRDNIPCPRRQLVDENEEFVDSEVEADMPVYSREETLASLTLSVGSQVENLSGLSHVEDLSFGLVSQRRVYLLVSSPKWRLYLTHMT
jgi:hypothetical protein